METNHQEAFEVSNYRTQVANSDSFDDDGRPKRTGDFLTASAHIISAVIGSGVISLAWAFAQLGWVAGLSLLILFSVVTYYASCFLAACYRTENQATGNRNYTYLHCVRSHLGRMNATLCGCVQYANLFGTAVGYTISASISMMAVRRSNGHRNSGGKNRCKIMISFAIFQILLSQISEFDKFSWLPIVPGVMSFTYSVIALYLGITKVIGNRTVRGSLTGVSIGVMSESQKFWRCFQALGNIASAYSYATILIEIQDKIKSPPEESKTMSKAISVSALVTSIFYLLCGSVGYAAFGDASPRNLLTGFGFYKSYWLVDIANVAILVHLVAAFQVDCQFMFLFIENLAAKQFPDSDFIKKEFEVPVPGCEPLKLNLFRLVSRTTFVICCTGIAILVPFSTDIVELIRTISYWPLTVYFPVEMYIVQTRIRKWSTKWICLQMLSATCFVLIMLAAVGSTAGLLHKVYNPLMPGY
ncbi:amino acid permease 3 [Vigna radiata var. radiata]|uniref:Amino acid permease 3 n=1 Tax=Vigna radiata var. radiata TaxID=3916 RepID=A0A1S3UEU4_VIGRR|nr:amino acid permease 3 [Vigna radiata var. radiata]